jgi:D-alanyl-D-alanine carboxypeptidase (penicillin-binding protein 5/6)
LGADVEKKRFAATQALLNYGFSFYETHKLYDADEALTEARIYKGEVNELPLGLTKSLYVTIPKGRYKEMHASLRVNTSIEAPASVGAPYGSVTVTLGDDKVAEIPLVALRDVPESGFMGRLVDEVKLKFHSMLE